MSLIVFLDNYDKMIENYFQSLVVKEDAKHPPNLIMEYYMVYLLEPSTKGPLKAYPVKKQKTKRKTSTFYSVLCETDSLVPHLLFSLYTLFRKIISPVRADG